MTSPLPEEVEVEEVTTVPSPWDDPATDPLEDLLAVRARLEELEP